MGAKKSNTAPKQETKTRNYACVVYPESAPDSWFDILTDLKVSAFVSPLHDRDINADNTPKKPHYHVFVMFDGPKTRDYARKIFEKFGGVGCETVNSLRGYARYLCHLDNPEKAQYRIEDVRSLSGAQYMFAIGTAADKAKAIREMIAYIEENDIVSWSDLLLYASTNRDDWFDCLINSGAYVTKEFIKSRTWKMHHNEEK